MNRKQITCMVLLGLGLSMFLYGYSLHVQPVFNKDSDTAFAAAEPAMVKEVSIGGLMRKPDGTLHKTYSGTPPKACPT